MTKRYSHEVPDDWRRHDKYAMTRGRQSICRVYIDGVMWWEMFNGDGPAVYRGRDDEGAYAEALLVADTLLEKAA